MKTWKNTCAALAIFGSLAIGSTSHAAPEADDAYPWSGFYAALQTTPCLAPATSPSYSCAWSPGWGVLSSGTDVDYLLMMCGRANNAAPMKVTRVAIDLSSSNAPGTDLDIHAYTIDGKYIGSSTSVTSHEEIDVSSWAKDVVVMKVYGYRNTFGSYGFTVSCQE